MCEAICWFYCEAIIWAGSPYHYTQKTFDRESILKALLNLDLSRCTVGTLVWGDYINTYSHNLLSLRQKVFARNIWVVKQVGSFYGQIWLLSNNTRSYYALFHRVLWGRSHSGKREYRRFSWFRQKQALAPFLAPASDLSKTVCFILI